MNIAIASQRSQISLEMDWLSIILLRYYPDRGSQNGGKVRMSEPKIVVYGTNWCGDCLRTRYFLDRHHIPYTFINIDKDKQAEQFVFQTNHGMRSVPTIVFEDESILVEPSTTVLAMKLDIST
jgi:mycoredoxin